MTNAVLFMALIVLGVIGLTAFAIFMLTMTVRHLLRMMAARAIDGVVRAGEKGIRDGVSHVATSVAADMKKRDPKRLEPEVIKLAQKLRGRVSVADIVGATEVASFTAQQCLAALVQKKMCRPKPDGSTTIYIFENFLPVISIRLCPFCETEFPKSEEVNCPNCGGAITVKQVKEA